MDEDLIFIEAKESGERIDALLARSIEGFTRSGIQKLIEEGHVLLSGKANCILTVPLVIKKNYKTSVGDQFEISIPEISDVSLVPQDLPLNIVFEDNSVIVINKQRGMVVHPAPGHPDHTLVNALLYHCGDSLSGIGGEKRPGIVHRIDKDTSGLLIVAKNDQAHQFLSAQLSDRSLSRTYYALVNGNLRDSEGTINKPIGRHPTDRKRMAVTERNSKAAVTHWKKICDYRGYSLISCKLETGRTHQIRVHLSSIGHPLLGDGLYGAKCPDKGLEGQCLHATQLQFIHPVTLEKVVLEAPLPDYFNEVLFRLGEQIETY